MKILTVVSVTLLPASVILGFFGTESESPRNNMTGGFIVMTALIALTTAGSLALFARRGWIGGSAQGSSASTVRHRD
jgi:Mg2+ and Co2+ transporter CorA